MAHTLAAPDNPSGILAWYKGQLAKREEAAKAHLAAPKPVEQVAIRELEAAATGAALALVEAHGGGLDKNIGPLPFDAAIALAGLLASLGFALSDNPTLQRCALHVGNVSGAATGILAYRKMLAWRQKSSGAAPSAPLPKSSVSAPLAAAGDPIVLAAKNL